MGFLLLLSSCGKTDVHCGKTDVHYRVDGELGSYLSASYPQMTESGSGSLSRMALNTTVEERVLGHLEDSREDIIEGSYDSMEGMKTDPASYGASFRGWRCEITYHLGHLEHDSVSICLKEYWYTGGHGNWSFTPVNLLYGDAGVEDVLLEALFDQSKEWQETVDRLIWAGFIDSMVVKGANEEDLRKLRTDTDAQGGLCKETSFTYAADGVTFYFAPYRLSSFSMGDFVILVPIEKIEELLNSNGPMRRYL